MNAHERFLVRFGIFLGMFLGLVTRNLLSFWFSLLVLALVSATIVVLTYLDSRREESQEEPNE